MRGRPPTCVSLSCQSAATLVGRPSARWKAFTKAPCRVLYTRTVPRPSTPTSSGRKGWCSSAAVEAASKLTVATCSRRRAARPTALRVDTAKVM